ncbi:MAG TPA: response regulator transcription factor [Tissierellaceae bacterium]|nr:response regulator transcription factor [Tissierellaceae bacterium]
MAKLLLVEDDTTLAMGIEYSLEKEGYHIDIGRDFSQGKKLVDENQYDLIILDIGLPDGSGFDLCKYIRRDKTTPIIFLTAKDEEVNVVMGLDIGADDYITKPFRIRELLSRIKAVLRRYDRVNQGNILSSQDLKVHLLESKVMVRGEHIYLTPSEYKLLIIFLNHPKQVLARRSILENLWDIEGDFIDDNSLSVYIKRLREKIELDTSQPEYIKTIRGIGYIWDKDVRGD